MHGTDFYSFLVQGDNCLITMENIQKTSVLFAKNEGLTDKCQKTFLVPYHFHCKTRPFNLCQLFHLATKKWIKLLKVYNSSYIGTSQLIDCICIISCIMITRYVSLHETVQQHNRSSVNMPLKLDSVMYDLLLSYLCFIQFHTEAAFIYCICRLTCRMYFSIVCPSLFVSA